VAAVVLQTRKDRIEQEYGIRVWRMSGGERDPRETGTGTAAGGKDSVAWDGESVRNRAPASTSAAAAAAGYPVFEVLQVPGPVTAVALDPHLDPDAPPPSPSASPARTPPLRSPVRALNLGSPTASPKKSPKKSPAPATAAAAPASPQSPGPSPSTSTPVSAGGAPTGQVMCAVASGGPDGILRIWEFKRWVVVKTLDPPHRSPINAIAFSPTDRDCLATAHSDGRVLFWSRSRGKSTGSIRGGPGGEALQCIAFHPRGHVVAAGTAGGAIRIYSVDGLVCLDVLVGHVFGVTALRFSPHDPLYMASGGEDGTVRVWRLKPQFAGVPTGEEPGADVYNI
jgi:hypothetical protein